MTDTTTTKFVTGTRLAMRWVTDHTMRTPFTVIKRTAKFVTLEDSEGKTVRVGIKTDRNGEEWALPYGAFSMAPTLKASSRV